jgi:hypothetical protein
MGVGVSFTADSTVAAKGKVLETAPLENSTVRGCPFEWLVHGHGPG